MKSYKKYKEVNLCRICGQPPMLGKTKCEKCHQKHLEYTRKFRKKRLTAGLCGRCYVRPLTKNSSRHCETCLKAHRLKEIERFYKCRLACWTAYGGKCVCCGTTNTKYFQLDHVNNDGSDHRHNAHIRGGAIYTWAFRNEFPNTLQILCANCHQAKTIYGGCTEKDHPNPIKYNLNK